MDALEKERGRIKIDGRLRVPGVEGVFALGDAAVDPDNPLGPLAQVADQQGKVTKKKEICMQPTGQTDRQALRNPPPYEQNMLGFSRH